ncbi:MAG: 5-formyltetrahydrofolate cyclo-ligase [Eubacteriales bacterium]|nr:5-formyltetrahydrofolate cyclo-ligase [Eubacteriales bacterium]
MEEKKRIRRAMFAARKAHSDEEINRMSEQIAERLFSLPVFLKAQRILAYADYNHEVRTGEIIHRALLLGKEVAVPRVEGRDMIFYKITDPSVLQPGYFGIPEPTCGQEAGWEEALMIMPGVAFDKDNRRVGYGGGFYDRYLEKHPKINTIALAFEFQIMDKVPFEPTDISPARILTEERLLCRKGKLEDL